VYHAQGGKYFFSHKFRVVLSGNARDDVIDDAVAEIGIGVAFTGSCDQNSMQADRVIHGRPAVGTSHIKEIPVHGKARRVIQDVPDCRILSIAYAGDQFGFAQVIVCWPFEIDQTPLYEDHQSCCRHGF